MPESGFALTYVRMKSHQSPDTQGPQHPTWLSSATSEAEICSSELFTLVTLYSWGKVLGTRLWDVQQPGCQAEGCRENAETRDESEVPFPCPRDSDSWVRWVIALKTCSHFSCCLCMNNSVKRRCLAAMVLFLTLHLVQVMDTIPQGCSFQWLWNSSRRMNSCFVLISVVLARAGRCVTIPDKQRILGSPPTS